MQNIGPSACQIQHTVFTSAIDLFALYGAERIQGIKINGGAGTVTLKYKGCDVPSGDPWLSAVTHVGTSPLITVSGTPDQTRPFLVEMDLAGVRGTATFKWSIDGGANWIATGVLTAATTVLGTTGITIAWPDSAAYVLGETYLWTATKFATTIGTPIGGIAFTRTVALGDEIIAQVRSIDSVVGVTSIVVYLADAA